MIAAGPDLIRLLVIPIFLYAAASDIRIRRVPKVVWIPAILLGAIALGWEALRLFGVGGVLWQLWLIRVVISIGLIAPLGLVFWWIGAFGLADAKAIVTIALVFPTFPSFVIAGTHLPLVVSDIGVFSLTILVNAVLVGLCYPFALAARNLAHGRVRPMMFVGIPVSWTRIESRHGTFLEGPEGYTRHGLDLDALRIYLRWRDCSIADIREEPAYHRTLASLPADRNVIDDGRIATDGGVPESDPWGARAFVEETGGPYGTRPEELRAALSLLAAREHVWVSPGIPFLVPLTIGLVVAIVYGDIVTALLALLA